MKSRFAWLTGLLCIGITATASADGPIEMINSTEPLARQAIEIAIPEAERLGLDSSDYAIEVYTAGDGLVVLFRNPGPRPAGFAGNPCPMEELEVEVDEGATQIVSSHFVR